MARRMVAGLAAVVVVAGAATAIVVVNRSHSEATRSTTRELATTEVTQRDLTIYDETTATLGFTTSVTVSSPVAGTVTSVLASGAHVDPGTVVATVDGQPVVAMLGDVPAYRALSKSSTDGIDVRQLEMNLVRLGFDPYHEIVIDNHYDVYTAASVAAWEISLGLAGDGKVAQGLIVYVPGHLLVDTVSVSVGGSVSSGGPLVVGRQTERSFLVSAYSEVGEGIIKYAKPGTPIATGTVLYWQGDHPVVAIVGDSTSTPALSRDLSMDSKPGIEVRLLEAMLVAGGFDKGQPITFDDTFDEATAAAVRRWWASLGITGAAVDTAADPALVVVPAGSFVLVPGGLFAGPPLVADGTAVVGAAVVTSLTTAARDVTTSAPVGDATFALGKTIEVKYPDGTLSTATVVKVGNVATTRPNAPGSTPTVQITLHVADIPKSVDDFVQIPVTLRVVSSSEKNALVVPVSALVALAEGGYALEVVNEGSTAEVPSTTLIAVKPGLFADGFVSVTGAKVKRGMTVVVPA